MSCIIYTISIKLSFSKQQAFNLLSDYTKYVYVRQ